jgi:hypothetical protein
MVVVVGGNAVVVEAVVVPGVVAGSEVTSTVVPSVGG